MRNTINMKKIVFTFLLFVITYSINAQTIFDKWNTRDEKTGNINSVVEIYKKNGKAYAKIIKIIDPKYKDKLCDLCKGNNKNKPGVGINVLLKLEKKRKKWSKGYAFDPRNGNYYNCYIKLIEPNKLKVRGFVGIPIFGETVYWERASK